MVLTFSDDSECFHKETEASYQANGDDVTNQAEEHFVEDGFHQNEYEFDQEKKSCEEDVGLEVRDFSQNTVTLTLSWTLMKQLRYLARSEGIEVNDLLVELAAEGATRRAYEDANKATPSHLMTRNGYVYSHSEGNQALNQPQMSHHTINNRTQNGQARGKTATARHNNQYNNANNRYPNAQNRGYQNNNRNQQGNNSFFRQNTGNSFHQQKNLPRSAPGVQQEYNSQRTALEGTEPYPQNYKNKKY